MTNLALADIKVLDLTHHIAGPFCTRYLACLGAEVVKIERPGEGDPSRRAGPFPEDRPDPEKSGLYLYLNMGKKSITLDLKSATGLALVKKLVQEADVLVENFAPRVMPSLGLAYQTLREINPRLVMTSISNFGQTGSYRDFRAQDIVITAMAGLSYLSGEPGREPVRPGGSQAQYVGGTVAFTATMLALFGAKLSGEGQRVDVSLIEAMATNLEATDLVYSMYGGILGRGTFRYGVGYPIDVYQARDAAFLLSAHGTGGTGMDKLALLVEKPELVNHPLFDRHDPSARMDASYAEFDALLGDYFETHDRMEIVQKAQEMHMPFAPVQDAAELFADPQAAARGFFVSVDHPVAGSPRLPGTPWTMSASPSVLKRAPFLGEHNKEILCGRLGIPKGDLPALYAAGVI